MSASLSPVAAARSRPATAVASAAPQRQQQSQQRRARKPLTPPTNRPRNSGSRIVVAEAASSSSSAPKLTNKPAWAGEFAAAIQLGKSEEGEQKKRGTEMSPVLMTTPSPFDAVAPLFIHFYSLLILYLFPTSNSLFELNRRRPPLPLRQRPHLHQAPLRRHEGRRARRFKELRREGRRPLGARGAGLGAPARRRRARGAPGRAGQPAGRVPRLLHAALPRVRRGEPVLAGREGDRGRDGEHGDQDVSEQRGPAARRPRRGAGKAPRGDPLPDPGVLQWRGRGEEHFFCVLLLVFLFVGSSDPRYPRYR